MQDALFPKSWTFQQYTEKIMLVFGENKNFEVETLIPEKRDFNSVGPCF